MKHLLSPILILAVVAGCNNSTAEENTANTTEPPVAAPTSVAATVSSVPALPSFNMVDANGQVINLSDFKGKKVFVNLWATWCPPCRAEIPSIQKLHAKAAKDKAVFVMLSLDNNFEKAKQFAGKTKLGIPIYYPAANLPDLFNVQGIPATFIFNEKGELIHRQDGGADYDTKFYTDLLN